MMRVVRWLKALWEWLTGASEPYGKYVESSPTSEASPTSDSVGAEDLDFSENLTQGQSSPATKHAPPPGVVVLEAYNSEGEILLLERVPSPRCAPAGSKEGYTRVIVPVGGEERSHQYVEVDLGPELAPFPLPQHLSDKHPDRLRIWWSCHEE